MQGDRKAAGFGVVQVPGLDTVHHEKPRSHATERKDDLSQQIDAEVAIPAQNGRQGAQVLQLRDPWFAAVDGRFTRECDKDPGDKNQRRRHREGDDIAEWKGVFFEHKRQGQRA